MPNMPLKTLAIAGLLAFSLARPAAADETSKCVDAQSTVEINACFEKEYDGVDKALNAAYAKALDYVRSRKLDAPYDPKSFEASLKSAQRAWVAYRDADCKDLVPQQWSGGTGTTSAIFQCMIDKSRQRTKELKDLVTEQ
jgi:uncharacterized protein YecT (DUF1311 family)